MISGCFTKESGAHRNWFKYCKTQFDFQLQLMQSWPGKSWLSTTSSSFYTFSSSTFSIWGACLHCALHPDLLFFYRCHLEPRGTTYLDFAGRSHPLAASNQPKSKMANTWSGLFNAPGLSFGHVSQLGIDFLFALHIQK